MMQENGNRLRIHAQITPENSSAPEKKVRWRSIPHPGNRPVRVRGKLSASDRLLRSSAIACALLLAVLALGNIDQPWAQKSSKAVQKALTMHIDLDDSIGRLNFVREWMPESALVFFNLSEKTEFALPSAGTLTHPYNDAQPWLLFESTGGDVFAPQDGTITTVCTLGDGAAYAVLNRMKPLAAPMPAQIYLIDASTKKTALLRTLRTDRAALFLVRENGQIKRMIDDRAILSQLEKQE